MAQRHVKELLQAEVISALKTAPASDFYDDRVYFSTQLGLSLESMTPDKFPCLVVNMPKQQGFSPQNNGTARVIYQVEIYHYFGVVDPRQADVDMSEFISAILNSLASYYSPALQNCGWFEGAVEIEDGGMGEMEVGGNIVYMLKVNYPLHPPTTQFVDDEAE